MWYSVLGFLITFIFGYLSSVGLELLGWSSNDLIYINSNRNCLNYDLFVPPYAKYLKNKAAKKAYDCEDFDNNDNMARQTAF